MNNTNRERLCRRVERNIEKLNFKINLCKGNVKEPNENDKLYNFKTKLIEDKSNLNEQQIKLACDISQPKFDEKSIKLNLKQKHCNQVLPLKNPDPPFYNMI